jgi:hypothetical protein
MWGIGGMIMTVMMGIVWGTAYLLLAARKVFGVQV